MSLKEIKEKLKAPIIWGNLLAVFITVIVLFIALIWWLNSYTHHGDGIEMPDLFGVNYQKAQNDLEKEGLVLVVNDSSYNKGIPSGCILLQQPEKGMKVKQGRIVYVTINSLTMPRVAIPDLIDNSSYREAQAKLTALDFKMLPPKLIDGEKDWVYGIQHEGRNLSAGDMVAKESQLVLVIGNGSLGSRDDMSGYDDWSTSDSSRVRSSASGASDDIDEFLDVFE